MYTGKICNHKCAKKHTCGHSCCKVGVKWEDVPAQECTWLWGIAQRKKEEAGREEKKGEDKRGSRKRRGGAHQRGHVRKGDASSSEGSPSEDASGAALAEDMKNLKISLDQVSDLVENVKKKMEWEKGDREKK